MAAPTSQLPMWVNRYIGVPYLRGGRGPNEFDCWGLVLLVLGEQFGIAVPAYEGIAWSNDDRESRREAGALMARDSARLWKRIEAGKEQPGDVLLLRISGLPLHVGIVAAPGWMLHTAEDADSALEPYDGLVWGKRIIGFYRWAA